jgi:hypothetical protein
MLMSISVAATDDTWQLEPMIMTSRMLYPTSYSCLIEIMVIADTRQPLTTGMQANFDQASFAK